MAALDVAKFCLELPEAEEAYPFGIEYTVMKVRGKMFAIMEAAERPASISLKCDPTRAVLLRQEHPEITPGFHLNKTHWNTLALDADLDVKLVEELIRHSYDLVRPKPKRVSGKMEA